MNPNDPNDWCIKADRDLLLANDASLNMSSYPDLICYHCQQAAEKYLKALILHYGLLLKKTHDLETLLDILSIADPAIGFIYYDRARQLKNYAIGSRYPDIVEDPTADDIAQAIASAEFFRNFAKNTLGI